MVIKSNSERILSKDSLTQALSLALREQIITMLCPKE